MNTNRKVLTGLSVLIVLSLLVMPATAFAQPPDAEGHGKFHRATRPWKLKRMQFFVAEKAGVYPAYGSMFVHNVKNDRLLWSIPRVKCVNVADSGPFTDRIVYFVGKGTGKKAGKWVLVVAKEDEWIDVRTTKSKKYAKWWCKHAWGPHGGLWRYELDAGMIRVN